MAGENRRVRVRMSLGVEFDHSAAKAAFNTRLEYIRSLLTPPGLRSLDNHGLLDSIVRPRGGVGGPFFPGYFADLWWSSPRKSRLFLRATRVCR